MIIQGICAFFATAAFSVLTNSQRKYIIQAGVTGAFGWFIYLLSVNISKDKILATLCATLIVAIMAHILSHIYKAPVTMFLIPGIIPLVPGAGMYHIVQSIFLNDIDGTSKYFFETLKTAGAIALGIFMVDSFFREVKKKKKS